MKMGDSILFLPNIIILHYVLDLYEILAKSTDYDELLAVWKGWRDVCKVMKPQYVEYISLSNKAIGELGM